MLEVSFTTLTLYLPLFLLSPDIICISDTWLSSDIFSCEISIPYYCLFCLDRCKHGGGVAIYAHSVFHPPWFHSLSLHHLNYYWFPFSSPLVSFILQSSIVLVHTLMLFAILFIHYHFLSFIPVKSCPSWWLPCLYSHLQALHLPFCHISSNTDFQNLHQLVSSPTHFSHSGSPSVIDLVFVPPPFLLMSLIFLLLVLLTMYRFFCL